MKLIQIHPVDLGSIQFHHNQGAIGENLYVVPFPHWFLLGGSKF